MSRQVYEKLKVLQYDNICGVPYTALPIASVSVDKRATSNLQKKAVRPFICAAWVYIFIVKFENARKRNSVQIHFN